MTFSWIKRFLGQNSETLQSVDRETLVGLIPRGDTLIIVPPESEKRGVRLVTMPQSLKARYEAADKEFADVQDALRALPYSHRKRARRKRPSRETIAARPLE